MILSLPERFKNEKVEITYLSDEKCIISEKKIAHFIKTLPTQFSYKDLSISCFGSNGDIKVLYDAIKLSKDVTINFEKINKNQTLPSQAFGGVYESLEISLENDQE